MQGTQLWDFFTRLPRNIYLNLSSPPIAVAATVVFATSIAFYVHHQQQQKSRLKNIDTAKKIIEVTIDTEVNPLRERDCNIPLQKDTTMDFTPKCAACGERGGDKLKSCACKLVKYCSVSCQKEHRQFHKRECKNALLDEELFKQPPDVREDCPICFLPLVRTRVTYQLCCGKNLCDGCMTAVASETDACPFCRDYPTTSNSGIIKRLKKRMEAGDASAFDMLGSEYDEGKLGLPQDRKKALELWTRAAELGSVMAHFNIASLYDEGNLGERDMKKAIKHYQLAAMRGHEIARFNLGVLELKSGNLFRAMKHCIIAARAGHDDSLKLVKNGFLRGAVTKDDFEKTLRAHKESQDEIKSDQRDKATKMRAIDNLLASMQGLGR